MAFITNHLSFLFLILLFSCGQLQARESKFFSKFTTKVIPQEQVSVSSLKQEEEPSFAQQATNGYGLYGHGSSQNPSTTTSSASREFAYAKTPTEGYLGEGYKEREVPIGHHGSANYGYNTKQYDMSDMSDIRDMDSVNENTGYETKRYESKELAQSDSMLPENGKFTSNGVYETKQGTYYMSQSQNDNNAMSQKPQGLSDTRFMESGRYFYNVDNENSYLNKYQPVNRNYDGYRSSQRADSRNNHNYNNNQNAYEFHNSMEDNAEENQNEFSP